MPLQLTSFAGKIDNNNQALLTWAVANAAKDKSFELEKSSNKSNFSTVADINSVAGKSEYNFMDSKMKTPDTYYRLKLVGKDGSYDYSTILKLTSPLNNYYYNVLPNAAKNSYHFICELNTPQNLSLSIININGQEVYKKGFGAANGHIEQDINLVNEPAGVYVIRIRIGNREYPVKIVAN